MDKLTTIWKKALDAMQADLTPVSFETWIQPILPMKLDERKNTLYLSSGNNMAKGILKNRYSDVIEGSVAAVCGKNLRVVFLSEDEARAEDDRERAENDDPEGENVLNPRYNFDTFVVGTNNRFAHAAALAVSETPGKAYNPLFIYGGAGLGKTHLMHAIGHYINRTGEGRRVLYVSSEMFTNELIKAIKEQKNILFRNKYRNLDILMIDDIQFIEKKESTQEEIFHTINTLYEAGKQIIISSDRPPKDLFTLSERLRSRFEWGIVVDIQPPDYETKVAILRNKAELENYELKEGLSDVIFLIAEKIHSNIRELEGALNRVIFYGKLMNRPIDRDLAKEVLKDVFSAKDNDPGPEAIKKQVCRHFNIKLSDMESAKRSRNFSHPRQIAMYLCRSMTDLSLPKIGECFGNRDHTTVLHACDKIGEESAVNASLGEILRKLEEDIRNAD